MTCKEVLKSYFLKNPEEWHKKVHLYAVAEDFSPETVGRTLRELEEENYLTVGYYDGKYSKGLAKYILGKKPRYQYYSLPDGTIIKKQL